MFCCRSDNVPWQTHRCLRSQFVTHNKLNHTLTEHRQWQWRDTAAAETTEMDSVRLWRLHLIDKDADNWDNSHIDAVKEKTANDDNDSKSAVTTKTDFLTQYTVLTPILDLHFLFLLSPLIRTTMIKMITITNRFSITQKTTST